MWKDMEIIEEKQVEKWKRFRKYRRKLWNDMESME